MTGYEWNKKPATGRMMTGEQINQLLKQQTKTINNLKKDNRQISEALAEANKKIQELETAPPSMDGAVVYEANLAPGVLDKIIKLTSDAEGE